MGIDFSQIKATKSGLVSDNYGYRERYIINIKNMYEEILKKSFPMKYIISDDFYDNCINSMYSKEGDILKYYNEYLIDLKEFPFEDFKQFNSISVNDIEKYIKEHESDEDNDIISDFTILLYDNETIEDKLNEYKDVFKDILKYVELGYIYYYIIQ